MSEPEIFVAVPVFHGQEVIAETLRSIRDQTFTNYRVVISVDNNDAASAKACRPFTSDPRVSLVVQPQQLGWAGNLNWLIDRCSCPFFVYWQQDDITATNYLESLRAELMAHPAAAIAYADVQWFGARFGRDSCPNNDSNQAQRVLQAIEIISFVPLRGLMRADFLPRPAPIPLTGDESCHSEFPFLVELAARGEFRRVANTLYFKRAHTGNTFGRWHDWPPWRRRRAWIEMGLGFLRVAQRVMPAACQQRMLLATILDRLAVTRPGRGFFYQPPHRGGTELADFARDFIAAGNLTIPPDNLKQFLGGDVGAFVRPVRPDINAALHAEEQREATRRELGERLERDGEVLLDVRADGDGLALLGSGWSWAERWGVWTDGEHATLRLPLTRSCRWRIVLEGRHYGGPSSGEGKTVRVLWRVRSAQPYRTETLPAGAEQSLPLDIDDSGAADGCPQTLHLHLPDSVFLPSVGVQDPRQVGFGLTRLRIVRRDRATNGFLLPVNGRHLSNLSKTHEECIPHD